MLDGLERDAIFITEDVVYYVEATTSKAEAKAIGDIQKLVAGADKLRKSYPNHVVQAVFVTLDDPTGHQGVAITNARGRVRHYTFDQFRARLVDARAYLAARNNYPFGSVRDPATDAPDVPENSFVPPTLFIKGEQQARSRNFRRRAKMLRGYCKGCAGGQGHQCDTSLPGRRGRLSLEPGIETSADTPASSSTFIDEDFADVLSGIDVSEYVCRPYVEKQSYWPALQFPLGAAGVEAGALRIKENSPTQKTVTAALSGISGNYPANLGNIDIVNIFDAFRRQTHTQSCERR